MQVLTATVTFTAGTAVVLSTLTPFAAIQNFKVSKLFIEPASANTHKLYVGDALLATGTSTVDHVIKQVAKPTAADAILDNFDLDVTGGHNLIDLTQFSVDGTTAEKGRVTVHVG